MIDPIRSIELGGISAISTDSAVALLAKHYSSAHLGERAIVRLVREPLREVEDLSLSVLDLTPGAESRVGYVMTRAVGFPAWPIINDPKNAKHALNLVADLKRAAKLAPSSPKQSRELLDQLAAKLDSSAPHFIPTFLEEGARIFLATDNNVYAAQLFAKAREAERTHSLPIDETRHRAVLLEFALAGALSAKELTNEAKSLLERTTPEQALELFNRLNIDRVRGGLPPYAGLGADLKRISQKTAAGVKAAQRDLIAELLGYPALQMAPQGFWTSFLAPLKELAANDPQVRELLLTLAPDKVKVDDWVSVLESVGITEEMRSGVRPATKWVEHYIRSLQDRWDPGYPEQLCLLIRSIPTLRGTEITLASHLSRLQPELLDALLEAGVKVSFDNGRCFGELEFADWLNREDRADLDFLAASEHARHTFGDLGSRIHRGTAVVSVFLAHSGTRTLLKSWAKPQLGDSPTLDQFHSELERLEPLFTPQGWALAGEELNELVTKADSGELLACALRSGLITELTWPALEDAAAKLLAEVRPDAPSEDRQLSLHEAWPAVGVSHNGQVYWVEGEEIVAHAQFAPVGGNDPDQWSYTLVDQVTGCHYRVNYSHKLIWSNDPGTVHDLGYIWESFDANSITFPVPGGRLTPVGIQRVNDSKALFTEHENMLNDGESYWSATFDGIFELDPATGRKGRKTLPSRLADLVEPHLRDGFTLTASYLMWYPATEKTQTSRMSTIDGMHTFVVLDLPDLRRFLSGDGTFIDLPRSNNPRFRGLVDRPGGGTWLLGSDRSLQDTASPFSVLTKAWDGSGQVHLLHQLPKAAFHYLQVRDAPASARLRKVTSAEVEELLAVTPAAHTYERDRKHPSVEPLTAEARAAVTRLLGTTDPALVDSVVWLAARTKYLTNLAQVQHQRANAAELVAGSTRAESAGGTFAQWEPSHKVLDWAVDTYGDRTTTRAQALALGALVDREVGAKPERSGIRSALSSLLKKTKPTSAPAPQYLQDLGSHPYLAAVLPEVLLASAAMPLQPVADIEGAAALVGAYLDAGLYTQNGVAGSFALDQIDFELGQVLSRVGGPSFNLGHFGGWIGQYRFLLWSPAGNLPPEVFGAQTVELQRSYGVDRDALISAFTKLLAGGPPTWDPERVTRLADGLGWTKAAAALLLTGIRGFNSYDKNFMPREVREFLGLKVAEADEARTMLRGVGANVLLELIQAGAQDPIKVVEEGLDIEAMISFWTTRFGVRKNLPDELFTEIEAAFPRWGASSLRKFLADEITPDLLLLSVLLWLAARLERDDPARLWIVDWSNQLKQALLAHTFQWNSFDGRNELRHRLGLPTASPETTDGPHQVGAWTLTGKAYYDTVTWSPAEVVDWEAENQLLNSLYSALIEQTPQCAQLLSGAFDPIFEDLKTPGEGPGQDPSRCVPELVAQVATDLGLNEDEAQYWLQLLALPNPTDKNIQAWNNWTPARRKAAAKPLLEKGLLVEAKRSRAGRTHFLPGGWLEAAAPHLPIEVWKAPFFDLEDAQKVTPKQEVVVPLVPLPQLFADAYHRYQSGDQPGYTELRTTRYRR